MIVIIFSVSARCSMPEGPSARKQQLFHDLVGPKSLGELSGQLGLSPQPGLTNGIPKGPLSRAVFRTLERARPTAVSDADDTCFWRASVWP